MTRRAQQLGSALILVLITATISAGSAVASGTHAAPASVIKVGVEGPMTGPQHATGIDMWRGAQLLANSVNAAGGVDGHHLQLVRIDDKAQASTAVSVARGAIAQHIVALIGPYNSSVGIVNLPIYRRAGIAIIRLTSNHTTNGFGITVQPMDYQVATVESKAILATLTAGQRVALVYDTSTYTSGIAEQLRLLLNAGGLKTVAFESFATGTTKFTAQLKVVKKARPQLVYYAAYDHEAEQLVDQANTLGITGRCLVDGLAAEGSTFVHGAGTSRARHCIFSGVPTTAQLPNATSYVRAYEHAYHAAPGTWGAFSYDSLQTLVAAIKSTGGFNAGRVIRQLLHTTGVVGLTGSITIDPENGNRNNPPVVILDITRTGGFAISSLWRATGKLPFGT